LFLGPARATDSPPDASPDRKLRAVRGLTFVRRRSRLNNQGIPVELRVGLDQSVIDEIVRRILTVAAPDRIILFGSAATGSMNADSDIDLLIVAPEIRDVFDEWVRVRESLGDLDYSFDLLFITTGRFEATKDLVGGLAYPAHREGRIIYHAA
jgi:predicted nucleotidyltransferase